MTNTLSSMAKMLMLEIILLILASVTSSVASSPQVPQSAVSYQRPPLQSVRPKERFKPSDVFGDSGSDDETYAADGGASKLLVSALTLSSITDLLSHFSLKLDFPVDPRFIRLDGKI